MTPSIAISLFLGLLVVLLLILLIIEKRRKAKILGFVVDQEVRYLDVQKELQNVRDEQLSKDIEKTDGFLKFVSDSREWAFAYIEDVQSKLNKFDKDIEGILNYYSLYDSNAQGIHVDLAKQVSEVYTELKSVLPKE
jgi:hypothetical protein